MANRVMWLNYRLAGCDIHTYEAMTELSIASADRYLAGDWTALVLTGDMTCCTFERGFSRMYREMFAALRDCYEAGDSVLFLDPDTLFLRPTEIFGRFDELMLFWLTDPSVAYGFDPYLNAGIVYVPASMDPTLWRFVDDAAPSMSEWNDSQIIFNRMFYAQQPVPELHPELNWSPSVEMPGPLKDAHLVHFNSTRGAPAVLERMRALSAERVTD